MSFFLVSFSFLFLFRLIPWSAGALCIHFPAWASKTHSRRCLRGAPSAIQEGSCGLHEQSKSRAGALVAFCINQGLSASFLSSIFLTAKFFPYLFLYFSESLTPSFWGNPWIQPGLDSGIESCSFPGAETLLQIEISLINLSYKRVTSTAHFQSSSYACCFFKNKQRKIVLMPKRHIWNNIFCSSSAATDFSIILLYWYY